MSDYPPEPWRLTAHAYVGMYLLPAELLPAPHSPETKPITLFGPASSPRRSLSMSNRAR